MPLYSSQTSFMQPEVFESFTLLNTFRGSMNVKCLISAKPCLIDESYVIEGRAASQDAALRIQKLFGDPQLGYAFVYVTSVPQIFMHMIGKSQDEHRVQFGVCSKYKPVLTFLEKEIKKSGNKISKSMVHNALHEAIHMLPTERAIVLKRRLSPRVLAL